MPASIQPSRGKKGASRFFKFLALAGFILLPGLVRGQIIDLNGNGVSDIWEWLYGAYGINPTIDSDGDGFSNLQEAIAGTNPLDSNSYPRISAVTAATVVGTNLAVTIPSFPGKLYQLQSVTPSLGTNWVVETNVEAQTGSNITLLSPIGPAIKYFRIAVSDVDSDGSGLMNDWEKYELGLNPTNAWSNNQEDINGNALSDYAYVIGKLAQQNVITISATAPTAIQPDPGQTAPSSGTLTLTRGGFPLNSITVNLAVTGSGPGYAVAGVDYTTLPATNTLAAGVNSQGITVTPLADTNLQTPVIVTLQLKPGPGYTVGSPSNASVVIYPSPTANGGGLLGQYFTNSSTNYASSLNFNPTNEFLTRTDAVVDFNWTNGTSPDLSNGNYTVRWTGTVAPQYSEAYTFDVSSDDGVKLWVNDQLLINKWQSQSVADTTGTIVLQAGTHYDLKLEYLQAGGAAQAHLSWYSPDQSKQIIPVGSLYATGSAGGSNAPSVVTSPLSAVAFLGQPFTFTVTGANTPLRFTANGLPPGLNFNTTNGLISGIPTVAGNFEAILTASNAVGAGASILSIAVINTGSAVVQEIWTNVPGTNITDIPTGTAASLTNVLGTLEGVTNFGDNYGERIRGYFTAPATGNYYFWIAGNDSAQLWISDDNDPVNKVLRSYVSPTNNGTGSRQWNVQASQTSPWLALVAGQQYYVEILHKTGADTNANWAVGWLQDPTGTNTTPSGVVPGYVLSRYYPPLPTAIPGTLFTANMLALPGVNSKAVGSATLRMNANGTQAVLNYEVDNLAGTATGQSINSDPYLSNPSELIFDISAAKRQPNGSFVWNIKPTGTLSAADIVEIINEGKASINVESTVYPNGEISGHFIAADGTGDFTPPPPPPSWTDDHTDPNAAARFLTQATFGAGSNDIALVQSLGYLGWLNYQFGLPVTHHLPVVQGNPSSDPTDLYPSTVWFNAWWQQSSTAQDQLRQRVAFALSEIMVVSEHGVLQNHSDALSSYYDTLLDNSFGNYRALLKAVTLTPAMGLYLNMQGNNEGSIITGLHADENYAREIEQLFSIGLNRLWPDGTLILNAEGTLVPTYNQNVVMGFAAAFTGWNYYQTNQANGRLPSNWTPSANYTNAMVLVPSHHDPGSKLLLDNAVLPPAQGLQLTSTNVAYDNYGLQNLESAMDSIYNNQNVGPFICRQLIQRLVTSDPSRDYVYRVTQVFNDDGTGVRGNLQAVITAILLDYEARSTNLISQPDYGKQREPLLRATAMARAFPAPPTVSGTYNESGGRPVTVTTSAPHRLNSGDTVFLQFTDTSSNAPPMSQGYSVTVSNPTTFTVNCPNLSAGTYGQTNSVLTVNITSHGLLVSNPVYLIFTTGGASNGLYQVASVPDSAHFTVTTTDTNTLSGNCMIPRLAVGGYTQVRTNITVSTTGPHGLDPGDTVYINFTSGTAVDGNYQVATVPDLTHFTITTTNSANQNKNSLIVYLLAMPRLVRSGNVVVQQSTWNMGYTDTGATSSLSESPLRSPTVFNFYFPSYEFPGVLASAGLTTPEFQLTSDTGVALQMNFLGGAVTNNTGNTNGLSSFTGGNGSIVLDISPWMTTNYTSPAGVPKLVSALNSLLVAGQLSPAAQSNIIQYVTNTVNFPYSSTPTAGQMRDRVRGVIYQIISSPDYTIQR